MAESLKGKIVLISGAASGIGRATAKLFGQDGAFVLVADFDEAGGRETVAAITEAGGQADFYQVDVSDAEQMSGLFKAIAERFGGLDVLMNNAGIALGGGSPIDQTTESAFDKLVAVNLRGVFLGIKYGIPLLRMKGGGRIINTASVAGLVGYPGNCGYAASKAGVVSLTKTAALEYGKEGIQVNCICPAYVETPILGTTRAGMNPEEIRARLTRRVPIGRIGSPDEVAETAYYLATGPTFVAGTAIVIDGGVTAM